MAFQRDGSGGALVGANMSVSRLSQVPRTRRRILTALKREGGATISHLSRTLNVSGEAVRQQLVHLSGDGWVHAAIDRRDRAGRSGRPATRYSLTPDGEHLFPKRYDGFALGLMDAIETELGPAQLGRILGVLAERTIRRLMPRMKGLSLEERLDVLRSVYIEEDPYFEIEVTEDDDGYRIIERNCPLLNVATKRPAVCSITIHSLSKLLGCRIVREKRFQSGHGRCVFHVIPGEEMDEETAALVP